MVFQDPDDQLFMTRVYDDVAFGPRNYKLDEKEVDEKEKRAHELREQERVAVTEWANGQDTVKQLVDIALLSNGLLKGEALNRFLKRSIDLL